MNGTNFRSEYAQMSERLLRILVEKSTDQQVANLLWNDPICDARLQDILGLLEAYASGRMDSGSGRMRDCLLAIAESISDWDVEYRTPNEDNTPISEFRIAINTAIRDCARSGLSVDSHSVDGTFTTKSRAR